MLWWVWVALGIAFVCVEIFLPMNFYILFIGLGFCLTGTLVSFDLLPAEWMQWSSAGIFSLVFYVGLKNRITRFSGAANRLDDYVGEIVTIKAEIAPGDIGSGELRGTGWQVKNNKGEALAANSKHQVTKTDGIILVIE